MPTHYIQANTNGRLHPATEPSIAPLNRGFLYGDAIYEVWRTYHGVIFAWDEHWARLRRSAESLFLKLEVTPESVLAEVRRTVAAYRAAVPGAGELYIRLQVTRGMGAIGLDVALADRADFLLLVQPCPVLTPQVAAAGVRLAVPTALRRNPVQSLDPAWKTGNYLNNLLCLREARSRGADDALILNLAGEIAEASVSNIAFVRRGAIVTPPLSAGSRAPWSSAGGRRPPGSPSPRRRCARRTWPRWTSASSSRPRRTSSRWAPSTPSPSRSRRIP